MKNCILDKFHNKYRIKSARWRNWDYREVGWYFVTICTKDRWPFFGTIENGVVVKTKYGELCELYWSQIPKHFPNCGVDSFIIMPDHVHGIISIYKKSHANLGNIIGSFKSAVTNACRLDTTTLNYFAWQTRFHDHVIRSENELFAARNYIRLNPIRVETRHASSHNKNEYSPELDFLDFIKTKQESFVVDKHTETTHGSSLQTQSTI